MNYLLQKIKDAWYGNEKLWIVFWVYGFLLGTVLMFLLWLIFVFIPVLGGIFSIVVLLTYSVWNLVSIWRCAPNCSLKIWFYLARAYVVLGVLACIMELLA